MHGMLAELPLFLPTLTGQVYTPDRLQQLMADSDYVVMALPHTPATHHFVNAAAINAMRPHGVLINVGRGKTLEEAALVKGARCCWPPFIPFEYLVLLLIQSFVHWQ
jgi:hypothetical protein